MCECSKKFMIKEVKIMNIDERIDKITKKMEQLATKNPQFTCGKFPPEREEP